MSVSSRMKHQYLEKSESVIHLPEWLLPRKTMEKYRRVSSRLAIVEIAGRDSVAAAVKAVKDEQYTDLLPTYAYTGTERGSLEDVEGAVARLAEKLPDTRVHELLFLGSPRFWRALNGRFIGEFVSRFGFYTPCIGCHLYLHSVRIPLAVDLGGIPIISGERESHDGSVKINQIREAVERYQDVSKSFGIPLLLPLRHVSSGDKIEEILGFEWEEGKEQLGCVLSGNYRMLQGKVGITREQLTTYLEAFAVPFTRKVVSVYLEGRVPEFMEIAGRFLRK